jgi:hypothetical protein
MLEPTEKVKSFIVEANELAIVDARVIKDMNPKHPLIKGAIIFPGNAMQNQFNVHFNYDEKANLNGATIMPVESVSPLVAPLSHGQDPMTSHTLKGKPKHQADSTKGQEAKLGDPVVKMDRKLTSLARRETGARQMQNPREKAKRSAEGKKKAGTAPVAMPTLSTESKSIMDFIKNISGARIIKEDTIQALPNKHLAKNVLDKLFGLSLGGWEIKEGKLYNEVKNQYADPQKWDVKDGLLFTKDGKKPDIDFDMVYEARQRLQAILDQDNAKEFATIEESISNFGKPIVG